jgi:hypothetical protein
MNPVIKPLRLKYIVLMVFCSSTLSLPGQSKPQIDIQFANPVYDRTTRTYAVDVELKSMTEPELLFGMNLRFFYDATLLQYKGIDQFHRGYGFLGDAPKAIVGAVSSGSVFFDFDNKAGYINGTVLLVNEPYPLEIRTDVWTKAFRVTFKVPVSFFAEEAFCPSIIWDKEVDPADGGFLPGSEGLLIAVVKRDRQTRTEALVANTYGHPFNWEYFPIAGLPHGRLTSTSCIPLVQRIYLEEDQSKVSGYDIFQNAPNPFDGETTLRFKLPIAQNVSIILYDINGAIKETIEGYYKAGENRVILKKKGWMVESGVIYYRLQTDHYTSRAIPKTLIRA